MDELHPDLFSEEPTPIGQPAHGWAQRRKRDMGYRPAREGETTCADCVNCIRQSYHGKNYYKCDLIGISRSEATDIRLKDTCKHAEVSDDT